MELPNNDITVPHNKRSIEWPIAFVVFSFQIIPVFVFYIEIPAWCWSLGFLFFVIRFSFVVIGYHRYFSHRSFKTSRVFQFLMAIGAVLSFQGGVLRWASIHRSHHKFSDTKKDLHSPIIYGFLEAHVLWVIRKYDIDDSNIKDLTRFPELVWLERLWMLPSLILATLFFIIGGWPLLLVGFFVSTTVLYHMTWSVSSIFHLFGTTRFPTKDHSKNNFISALLTMGEGWHNNHHHFPSSARAGLYWYEIDISFYIIYVLEVLGIVWDVKGVPTYVLEKNNI
ncbi:MAG: acyl-CoA desaturase [Planctomycetota bacterium]|nr:MAG: acyl-CoA desaturase [Planctomycetota bacterium]